MLEYELQSDANEMHMKNTRKATAMELNDETLLPGSNINASAKPVTRIRTLSHAVSNENHDVNIFGAGKYSTTLSTTAFGSKFFLNNSLFDSKIRSHLNRLVCSCFKVNSQRRQRSLERASF